MTGKEEGLLLHPSLQKKLSDLRESIKKIPNEVYRLGYDCALRKIQEDVSEVVSQLQDRIDKLVQDRNRVPLKTLSRILELEWAHVLITGETYKVLLVSPSTPMEVKE